MKKNDIFEPENDTKWQGYNRFMETNFRRTSV